jgi:DNA invertase Pin-like site-specific DNA recombinase
MNRIGYARVSTRAQNLDYQLKALEDAGCGEIFAEKASGTSAGRPELERCLAVLKEGDKLVVCKLDRLGRNMSELVSTVNGLAGRGVVLVSLSENVDTSSPHGRLIFNVFAIIAEYERDLICERVQAARDAALARGLGFGRPLKLGAGDVAQVRTLLEAGFSMGKAAGMMGVSRATLYRFVARFGVKPDY